MSEDFAGVENLLTKAATNRTPTKHPQTLLRITLVPRLVRAVQDMARSIGRRKPRTSFTPGVCTEAGKSGLDADSGGTRAPRGAPTDRELIVATARRASGRPRRVSERRRIGSFIKGLIRPLNRIDQKKIFGKKMNPRSRV